MRRGGGYELDFGHQAGFLPGVDAAGKIVELRVALLHQLLDRRRRAFADGAPFLLR